MKRSRVFVSSPLSGDFEKNVKNAERYCAFATKMGRAPYAPHLINIRWLDDNVPSQRQAGIEIGLEYLETCSEMWAFFPNGLGEWTKGMTAERDYALKLGMPIYAFTDKDGSISGPAVYIHPAGYNNDNI